MKKHPVAIMVLVSVMIVSVGASVAYYNTKSFGFDEDTVIFKQEEDGITVFDYKIYYEDLKTYYTKSKKYIPDKTYSTGPYIVDEIGKLII